MALPSANDDVARAIVLKWAATAALIELVPGGLQQGRLSSFQSGVEPKRARAVPYAHFEVKKGKEGVHQTGGDCIDWRSVRIEVRGLKADVENVLEYLRNNRAFNRATLQTQATFLACLQTEDDDLKEDDAPRAGEDIWVGCVALEVATQRPE